jgi:hypothetical protein
MDSSIDNIFNSVVSEIDKETVAVNPFEWFDYRLNIQLDANSLRDVAYRHLNPEKSKEKYIDRYIKVLFNAYCSNCYVLHFKTDAHTLRLDDNGNVVDMEPTAADEWKLNISVSEMNVFMVYFRKPYSRKSFMNMLGKIYEEFEHRGVIMTMVDNRSGEVIMSKIDFDACFKKITSNVFPTDGLRRCSEVIGKIEGLYST